MQPVMGGTQHRLAGQAVILLAGFEHAQQAHLLRAGGGECGEPVRRHGDAAGAAHAAAAANALDVFAGAADGQKDGVSGFGGGGKFIDQDMNGCLVSICLNEHIEESG